MAPRPGLLVGRVDRHRAPGEQHALAVVVDAHPHGTGTAPASPVSHGVPVVRAGQRGRARHAKALAALVQAVHGGTATLSRGLSRDCSRDGSIEPPPSQGPAEVPRLLGSGSCVRPDERLPARELLGAGGAGREVHCERRESWSWVPPYDARRSRRYRRHRMPRRDGHAGPREADELASHRRPLATGDARTASEASRFDIQTR